MAHCPYSELRDIEDVLEKIRALPKIKEPKPGTFYLKGQGFLHFHIDQERRRWADVRDGKNWGAPIDLAIGASKAQAAAFLKEVERRLRAASA